MTKPSAELHDLTVSFHKRDPELHLAVKKVSLLLRAGELLGLAGESGCGKTTTAYALAGYPAPGSTVLSGSSTIDGVDVLSASISQRRRLWGDRVAFVAQNASASLNPSIAVGRQLTQVLRVHQRLSVPAARERAEELLTSVGLPDPRAALSRFPHQFSGGQQQRISIAIAVACDPAVLILDEPTTGLDVTTQAQISAMLRDLLVRKGMAGLYVSHDLALLSSVTDRLAIMYAGEIVESGPTAAVLANPAHPYTRALLGAVPDALTGRPVVGIPGAAPLGAAQGRCGFLERCARSQDACRTDVPLLEIGDHHEARCVNRDPQPFVTERTESRSRVMAAEPSQPTLLEVDDLSCRYGSRPSLAVDRVSFSLCSGQSIGILGESGSGKSTLLRALGGLHPPSDGSVVLGGERLAGAVGQRSPEQRRLIQLVFQNADSSLNPRMTIGEILTRPLVLFRPDVARVQRTKTVAHLLDEVRLPPSIADRYPGDLSGGQRQRIALARAFAARPSLILADEVTSALDVSVQAAVLQLLRELAIEHQTALVFVSHDLAVLRDIAPYALVMRDAKVVERGPTDVLFAEPKEDYTRALVAAIPSLHSQSDLPESTLRKL